jgi:hypothetical protein
MYNYTIFVPIVYVKLLERHPHLRDKTIRKAKVSQDVKSDYTS